MNFFAATYLHCISVCSKSIICVNFGQKVDFLKKTPIQHFHSCILVFSYHVSIILEEDLECILPSHLLAFSIVCIKYRKYGSSSLSTTHSVVCALVYFDPNFKAKIKLFLTFMLLNFLVRTMQCAETLILYLFSDLIVLPMKTLKNILKSRICTSAKLHKFSVHCSGCYSSSCAI